MRLPGNSLLRVTVPPPGSDVTPPPAMWPGGGVSAAMDWLYQKLTGAAHFHTSAARWRYVVGALERVGEAPELIEATRALAEAYQAAANDLDQEVPTVGRAFDLMAAGARFMQLSGHNTVIEVLVRVGWPRDGSPPPVEHEAVGRREEP